MAGQPKAVVDHGDIFDLDALIAEAHAEQFRFTLAGQVFTMASPEDMSWQVQMQASTATEAEGIALILSEGLGEQWDAFKEIKTPLRALRAIFEEAYAFYGISLGESAASPRSSKSTAGRSKRTSRSAA